MSSREPASASMPNLEPASASLTDQEMAGRRENARDASGAASDEGAGLGVLALLMAVILGFATCVTMLGLLLVDLNAELEVTLGQAGLLAAARAVSWALAVLALSAELSSRHRGAVLGLLSLTNQGGIVLGSSVGGAAIGLGGYGALALTMAADAALATGCALPLRKRRSSGH